MKAVLASESVVEAGKRPITRSLNDLLEEYQFDRDSLLGVRHVLDALAKFHIQLDPPFEEEGDLDDLRALKAKRRDEDLIKEIQSVIDSGGEDYGVELKSSIRFDKKREKHDPGHAWATYISEKLESKLSQEICAFLNRDGGTIFLGIQNDCQVCGCREDLDAFDSDGTYKDKSDLLIRQIVERNFLAPNRVLTRLSVECVMYDGVPVVIIRITKSEVLGLLKFDQHRTSQLYLRIGTSAIPVKFDNLEEYYSVILK